MVHRDYSIHTEGMPIQIIMFEDRMEIRNPGGLYGRIWVDQLGKVQPDIRNPALASSLEVLGITENRYSGIPTIKKEMKKYNLREPEFLDERGNFVVKFYKEVVMKTDASLTLKEVAVTFGFYDEYHFGKCFKKHFGYSPKSVALYKTKEV